ncbi:MAG: SH3 domain-containing protein, partial [Enterobacteriaceae bacterium]
LQNSHPKTVHFICCTFVAEGSTVNRKAIVIKEYISPYVDFIHLQCHEKVQVSHCDIEWPGWCWSETASGLSGWVPQQILAFQTVTEAVCLQEYDASELNVQPGEPLMLLRSLNGWYWAQAESGAQGWVPEEHVRLL